MPTVTFSPDNTFPIDFTFGISVNVDPDDAEVLAVSAVARFDDDGSLRTEAVFLPTPWGDAATFETGYEIGSAWGTGDGGATYNYAISRDGGWPLPATTTMTLVVSVLLGSGTTETHSLAYTMLGYPLALVPVSYPTIGDILPRTPFVSPSVQIPLRALVKRLDLIAHFTRDGEYGEFSSPSEFSEMIYSGELQQEWEIGEFGEVSFRPLFLPYTDNPSVHMSNPDDGSITISISRLGKDQGWPYGVGGRVTFRAVFTDKDDNVHVDDSIYYLIEDTEVPGDGGDGDITAPTIASLVPSASTPIDRFQSLQFDVTDNDSLAGVFVFATFASGAAEVVHDGDAFAAGYGTSTRIAIDGGYRYVVKRTGGWPSAVTLKVRALDMRGNAA